MIELAPLDLARTVGLLRLGRRDPTMRVDATGVWRATRTPDGPATLHLRAVAGGVEAEAWGPGAAWVAARAGALAGALDDPAQLDASAHPLVARLAKAHRGLRLPRSERVLERLVPTILSQKVTGLEAKRSWAALVRHHRAPAPGPGGLLLPPSAEWLAAQPSHVFHRAGVERRRADVIRRAAADAARLEALVERPEELERRLLAIPGIGPWTVAEVRLAVLGDADAVSVGDYHLPHMVSWALAGEPSGTEERMLELLEPFAGHRGRVLRLLECGGLRAPRYGPRLAPRSIAGL